MRSGITINTIFVMMKIGKQETVVLLFFPTHKRKYCPIRLEKQSFQVFFVRNTTVMTIYILT